MEMRRSGDQRHLAGLRDAQSDDADEGIGTALHHQQSVREPQVIGGFIRQRADGRSGCEDRVRPLLFEFRKSHGGQQRARHAAMLRLVMPADRRIAERADPLPGEPKIDVVLIFAHHHSAGEKLRLVALHPQRLRDHPFCRDGTGAATIDTQVRVLGRRDIIGFSGRTDIHPDHAGPQRLARLVQRNDGTTCRVHADRDDRGGGNTGLRHRTLHRLAHAGPPVLRVLLGP